MGICKDQDGKWKLSDGQEVLPKAIALEILHRIHEKTHWGTQAIVDQFGIKYMCIGIHNLATIGCFRTARGARTVSEVRFYYKKYDLWEGLWKKALKTVLQEIQQTPDAQDSDYNDITHDHLCGEGDLSSANEQIRLLSKSVLDKICNAAEKTFYQIPSPEIKTNYVNIKQFPSENFLQFVDRLRSQVERQVQDPMEDKVQRMPPWKYLGLQIAARTIVPQKLEIECNPKTLADLKSLCGSLKWAKLSHQQYHQNVPGLIRQFQLTRSQARAIVAACPNCQVQAMPSMEKAYLTLNPVMTPIQVVILLLLNSLAAA
ncbi:hypothetical protein DUI87_01492 [Hirundo rustica rustica]|uniref:Integrase-type domain-containing protein n=1 Tax=Hirundo rustica rustica TaxID=333673 RepID=A0A3M0LC63_HIRRU|nr:hypothetical protein DUI87_01492 [Hirundo rustica rustica]